MSNLGLALWALACLLQLVSNNYLGIGTSSSLTLVPLVTYTLNFTFTSRTITAFSTPTLTFTSNYNVASATLANCKYLPSAASTSYTAASCSVTGNSSGYYVNFTGIYTATLSAQTFLGLQVSHFLYSYK
jgi:hypothetical protein